MVYSIIGSSCLQRAVSRLPIDTGLGKRYNFPIQLKGYDTMEYTIENDLLAVTVSTHGAELVSAVN